VIILLYKNSSGNSCGTNSHANITSEGQTFTANQDNSGLTNYDNLIPSSRSSANVQLNTDGANSFNNNLTPTTVKTPEIDILWRNSVVGDNRLWLINDTTVTQGIWLTPEQDNNWKIEATVDFNRDGESDFLWRNYATGENSVWLMNNTTLKQQISITPVNDPNWKIEGVADFNQDKNTDILWRNYKTGENAVWLMDETTLIGGQGVWLTSVADTNWKIEDVADFNQDKNTDILWRNYTTGENAVWLMDKTTLIGGQGVWLTSVPDTKWKIQGIADFNNDSKIDILWRHDVTGENAVWLMDETTLIKGEGVWLTRVQDSNWKIKGIADFNNDGHADILWRNNGTGENAVWLMKDTALIGGKGVWLAPMGDTNWEIVAVRKHTEKKVTEPGNSLSTAKVEDSAIFIRQEDVTNNDTSDFYRFNVNQSGVFTASLTDLTGDADVRLIQDKNNNGSIDANEVIAWQWERGTTSESIRRFLSAGAYTLQVMNYRGSSSRYKVATNFSAATNDERRFSIQLNFVDGSSNLSQAMRNAVVEAASFWENTITHSSFSSSQTLKIDVSGSNEEWRRGAGGMLASAGAENMNKDFTGRWMPTSGAANINTNPIVVDILTANINVFRRVMIHEFAHVLGFGTYWGSEYYGRNLVNQDNGTYKANSYAGWVYGELLGKFTQTAIPVTTGVGYGSDYSHWKEQLFGDEIMTHSVNFTDMPISQMTIAAMRDIGWNVNFGVAESYSVSSSSIPT
jgi:Leishmanolysin/Bacterial pre-peptidase C-terminal domain